jgi:hypothetical protein
MTGSENVPPPRVKRRGTAEFQTSLRVKKRGGQRGNQSHILIINIVSSAIVSSAGLPVPRDPRAPPASLPRRRSRANASGVCVGPPTSSSRSSCKAVVTPPKARQRGTRGDSRVGSGASDARRRHVLTTSVLAPEERLVLSQQTGKEFALPTELLHRLSHRER